MILQAGLFIIGIILLYFGAELLVRGSARLARSFGMSALVVGLTVVAIGTSAPELVVSVLAAVRGQTNLTVGNVVGSNISNIALILGISALIYPIGVRGRLLSRGIPLMIAASVAFALLVMDGGLGRPGGLLLVVGLVACCAAATRNCRRSRRSSNRTRTPGIAVRERSRGCGTAGCQQWGWCCWRLARICSSARRLYSRATSGCQSS
jgi:cation:H+ antiporter